MTRTKTMDIPTSSPYYDRLRSLRIQIGVTPVGTPEYYMLNKQILELEKRARKKIARDISVGIMHV